MERKPPKPSAIPAVLRDELDRIAQEILLERTAEARQVAALETANKLLRRAIDLYGVAFDGIAPRVDSKQLRTPPRPPVVLNPCKWCGQPGTKKPEPSKFDPNPGWLCDIHYAHEVGDNQRVFK